MGVTRLVCAGLLAVLVSAVQSADLAGSQDGAPFPAPRRALRWINPGENGGLAAAGSYANDYGQVGVRNASGAVDAGGQPFFAALGSNGRACVSCHQPQDGMSLSLDSIRQQWRVTQGQDPLFALVDGANCPSLAPERPASHSLLLERGLFRVFLPWPPRDATGAAIPAEFTLEVLSDPTGCNTDPVFGLASADPRVSVYRRPRAAANTAYTTAAGLHLMSDARAPTLAAQAADAAATHMQRREPLTPQQLAGIVGFESQVYVAQLIDRKAGTLAVDGGEALLGPQALQQRVGEPASAERSVFALHWSQPASSSDVTAAARREARESILRGRELFVARRIATGERAPLQSCASCHDSPLTGMDAGHGWSDAGRTQTTPFTAGPELPVFRLHCDSRLAPPYGGRVLYTQDPGRALITGRCRDIGRFVTQQLRGLAARPPYFVDGSARTLRELVDFYDQRYRIGYSEREKQDLANFLAAL